jgi:hypothetical protein
MRSLLRRAPYFTAALIAAVMAVACGSNSGTPLNGPGFRMTVSTEWAASEPQSQAGATIYHITGPNNSEIQILAIPSTATPVAGLDLANDSLGALLPRVAGHITGTTVLSFTQPSETMVAGEPGMYFGSTL